MPEDMTSDQERVDCVILGAGILGLTIATELVDRGYRPIILARDLPEDLDSTAFASPWAGCNWSSAATNAKEQRRDTITFHKLGKLAVQYPNLVRRTPFKFFSEEADYEAPWYKELVYNYRPIPAEEVPHPYKCGVTYDSFTINGPHYYTHLSKQLRQNEVQVIRRSVSSLDEVFNLYPSTSLFVNATGLGSRTIKGVEDEELYPARGETVLVHAPGVTTCYNHRLGWGTNIRRYIIPRPGPDGLVILGGTYEAGSFSTLLDPKSAERILKDTYNLCPDLSSGEGWESIKVISHQVGFRPMRKGGMRLEQEMREVGHSGSQQTSPGPARKRKVKCLHAYGIGPAGYQASWGIAEEIADLARERMERVAKL